MISTYAQSSKGCAQSDPSPKLTYTQPFLFCLDGGKIPWIDKIAPEILVQKHMGKTSNIEPYVKQLEVAAETAAKEQYAGKRKEMNPVLELLETKEDEVSAETAHRIFAIVVKIAP